MADELDGVGGDQGAADRLDEAISAVLAGRPDRGVDPTVLWLAAAVREQPPASLRPRVRRRVERFEVRRWRPAQVAAAAFASVLFANGLGNIFNGAWVAENVGEAHSPHAFIEGGLALLALAVVVAVASVVRRALPYAVAGGVPLGLAYGVRGFGEIGEFAGGAILHIGQGLLAVLLLVLWWRARRYGSTADDEGGA